MQNNILNYIYFPFYTPLINHPLTPKNVSHQPICSLMYNLSQSSLRNYSVWDLCRSVPFVVGDSSSHTAIGYSWSCQLDVIIPGPPEFKVSIRTLSSHKLKGQKEVGHHTDEWKILLVRVEFLSDTAHCSWTSRRGAAFQYRCSVKRDTIVQSKLLSPTRKCCIQPAQTAAGCMWLSESKNMVRYTSDWQPFLPQTYRNIVWLTSNLFS